MSSLNGGDYIFLKPKGHLKLKQIPNSNNLLILAPSCNHLSQNMQSRVLLFYQIILMQTNILKRD